MNRITQQTKEIWSNKKTKKMPKKEQKQQSKQNKNKIK